MTSIPSIYHKAPELLLDRLAEVNANLAKQDKRHPAYKFWSGVADVMKFAYGYMTDLEYVVRQNDILRAENEFLKQYTRDIQARLQLYEGIKAEKLAGTFDDVVKRVDEMLNADHHD